MAVFVAAATTGAAAQPAKRAMTVDDQFRLIVPVNPLISPDGQWVMFTRTQSSVADNRQHATVVLTSVADGRSRDFLHEGDGSPMWAPDSRSVFFFRQVKDSTGSARELFQQGVADTVAVQRSHLRGKGDGEWQLSPDGTFFLVSVPEDQHADSGAFGDVTLVDEGSNGQTRDVWVNLWHYDIRADSLRRITQRDWSINSADISTDGRFAVVAARPDNQRNTAWKTELYVVDLSTGAVRQLTRNVAPESDPRWSPDGKYVVFLAVLLDKWELGNGDLWRIDVATGATTNITPNHIGRLIDPTFAPEGNALFLSGGYGTTRYPVRADIAPRRLTPLVKTDGIVRVGSWSADRRTFAYVYEDNDTPPDVYVGHVGVGTDRQQRLSDLNPWVRNDIALGSVQLVDWQSFDKRRIEGLLHLPPRARSGDAAHPLIVHVACGPGCNWLNGFSVKNHVYAGLGYAQLSPNVRGSVNYDDETRRSVRFQIEVADRKDLLTGVDAMVARGIAHRDSLAIDGWSYGGVLGGFVLTTTTRFKAASLGAMVSDFIAEYGATVYYDMERWFIGGNPWTQPERWRERSSLTHADRVRTPTLLHHGDLDQTCSPFQSMDYFVALRRFGTTARLIRYPDEGHDLQQPRHRQLRDSQDVAWMQRYVRGRE